MSIHLAMSRGRPEPGQRKKLTLRRRRRLTAVFAALAIPAAVLAAPSAWAVPQATLAGSNFQIDENANLKVDAPTADDPQTVDWATYAHGIGSSFPEQRAQDKATGQTDDSYQGGVKEDTECPGQTTGSIPNNKSDLLTFHVFKEAATAGNKGFLNLAWSRVSDPSGTTLMDFEFNQSTVTCAGSPNKTRTGDGAGPLVDDMLIEYSLDQGGARATITKRDWLGSAWGPATDLTANSAVCGNAPCAVGTINQTAIPATDSDGLLITGEKSPRTFGEAQIDLRLIFQSSKCTSFGSAMLKSRSSDSFTSQLKDFIAPLGIELKNCGTVIIRKETDPEENPNTTDFGYTKSFGTDPTTSNTFTLKDDGVKSYTGTVLFGTGYTVDEDVVPAGWDLDSINCNVAGHPSQNVSPTVDVAAGTVTFDINSDADVLDCTYTNKARAKLIIEKVTSDGFGAFAFTSTTLDPTSWTLTTTAAGAAGKDSRTFDSLVPGTYDAAETVPTGWNLTSATCSDSSPVTAIVLSAGETVTCTFTNARQRGAIEILKLRKHAAGGSGDQPHPGVIFTVTGGSLPAGGTQVVTGSDGSVCLGNLVVSSLAGNYSVLETVPDHYVALSTNPQTGIVVTEGTCADKTEADVTFHNMPLTDISVSVNSQVNGGTASTIDCEPTATDPDKSTDSNGDATFNWNDLQPGTYTCTVVIDP